ncbi:MAG TPA: fasciclin domain-containing protein [Mucilaginibacter sp.]|jgi:uncharacterized surface protein with fasciclin (FAS1) repeats|nr:fasciclin domain-containing protein [Mucilaginibacter sp.]
MKKPILIVAAFLTFSVFATQSFAQTAPAAPAPAAPAGGGDVVASATSSDNYTAFSIALRAAGLSETLEGAGPYTIFAPTNEAFGKIPSAQLDALIKDPAKLATLIKGHIVSGKLMKADVIKALTTGKGKAVLKTLDGQDLTLSVAGGKLQLADAAGNTALVTSFDLAGSNGVIHGLNAVLVGK